MYRASLEVQNFHVSPIPNPRKQKANGNTRCSVFEVLMTANNYRVFQREVSRTIAADSVNHSGLLRSERYCYNAQPNCVCLNTCLLVNMGFDIIYVNLTIRVSLLCCSVTCCDFCNLSFKSVSFTKIV